MNFNRFLHTVKNHTVKCGLEIHMQLKTTEKLFSAAAAPHSLQTSPNTCVAYFDIGLPGSQPKLNYKVLTLALRTAILLDCHIQEFSSFDRKHYFYGDQPLGYQITQHYHPFALKGQLKLTKRYDDVDEEIKNIRIQQLQIEQDTAKSIYKGLDGTAQVDFNRANIPLIEMVTEPDFQSAKQVKAFLRKYQHLMRSMGICTGDLETGAMRADVNLSVDGGPRVEIKNLSTTSAIVAAIEYETERQIKLIESGECPADKETRGWNGKQTMKLRSKETTVDYRYMPDPELAPLVLDVKNLVDSIKATLSATPDELTEMLLQKPYSLQLRDARILLGNELLLQYFLTLFKICVEESGCSTRLPVNWCCHELLGIFGRQDMHFSPDIIPVETVADVVVGVSRNQITSSNAKLLLQHLASNPEDANKSVPDLIEEYDLGVLSESTDSLNQICIQVMEDNSAIVKGIREGKKTNTLNFLIGQAMRKSGGKLTPKAIESKLKELIFTD